MAFILFRSPPGLATTGHLLFRSSLRILTPKIRGKTCKDQENLHIIYESVIFLPHIYRICLFLSLIYILPPCQDMTRNLVSQFLFRRQDGSQNSAHRSEAAALVWLSDSWTTGAVSRCALLWCRCIKQSRCCALTVSFFSTAFGSGKSLLRVPWRGSTTRRK